MDRQAMNNMPRAETRAQSAFFTQIAGLLAAAFGVLVLLGWALDLTALKSILPGLVAVKPNTALAFVLIGLALVLRRGQQPENISSLLARGGAMLAGLIGMLTLAEYMSGANLGIDQCLFREPAGVVGTSHPGRMAPDTALCFVLLAAASWLAGGSHRTKRRLVAAAVIGVLVMIVAVAAGMAYFSPALRTQGWWGQTIMAPLTAAVFAVLAMAIIIGSWRDVLSARFTRFTGHLWRTVACVAALAVAFALYVRSEQELVRAHELRFRSFQLADELRQSGDDLTRMARTYVVTGEPIYKQHFRDILDIRDGKRPRPEHYSMPFWDLALGNGPAPRAGEQAVPLLELMRQAGFTEEEFGKLAEAKANSDGLTIPEFAAMRLVETTGPQAGADRARARLMMHDERYHQAKAAVMGPIYEFYVRVDKRTLAAVEAAGRSKTIFRWLFAVCGLVLLFALWRTYVALGDTMGGSVDEVGAHIARIGGGDFCVAIPVKVGLENSVLGWLSATQAKLRDLDHERTCAEDEIRQLNAELERRVVERTAQLTIANKELEAFSYSVSHDLRAPLRHVQGYVDMLAREAEGRLSDKGRHCLKTIADTSREMGELIDNLLAFSRMGRAELIETKVDFGALVNEARRDLEPVAHERNIDWKIPPLPAVQADPAMLKLVLANLLGNAVKFTLPRDPAEIEMGVMGSEDGRVVLFVRDNGVGFDPQYAGKLFGVFQRLHRADEFAGTGIGLANVRRIIARHGGRTWADGVLDKGATFYFTLKAAE